MAGRGRLDPTDRSGLRSAQTRTCVGCRGTDSRSVLLRVVAEQVADGSYARLVPDPGRSRPGRGAWLHARLDCLSSALRRKAFGRALRLQTRLDTGAVEDWVAELSHGA